MRRIYEYLQTGSSLAALQQKQSFLSKIDACLNQRQYVRMTLLDWEEHPLKEIQGVVTNGSLTKDGSSSVRRTMSLTVNLDGGEYDATSLDMDFSLNKKVFVELGVKNDTEEWEQYPVLWFPQGVFFINKASMSSSSSSSVTLSLTLKDKMSMLNGDVGGVISASTIFDSVDTQSTTGEYISQKVTVYEIIENVVNHFGGEDLANILIEDVDLKIRRVMKWTGENDLYLYAVKSDDGTFSYYSPTVTEREGETADRTISQNEDCGYIYDDFVYTSDLTLSAGSKVTDVLDKIVSYLGNYEYFYDEFGIFHFREIKNYVNTTHATTAIEDMTRNSYLMSSAVGKSSYAFSDSTNIMSLSSSPSYDNIKNDYIVEGTRKSTSSDVSYSVRYHLAIDSKPEKTYWDGEEFTYEPRFGAVLYEDPDTGQIKLCFPSVYNSSPTGGEEAVPLPEIGTLDIIYYDKNFLYQKTGVKEESDKGYYLGGENDVGKPLYLYKRLKETFEEGDFKLGSELGLSDYAEYYIPQDSAFQEVSVSGTEEMTSQSAVTVNVGKVKPVNNSEIKDPKTYEYKLEKATATKATCVRWNGTEYEVLDTVATFFDDEGYTPQDWRTELYVQGELARANGTDKGYYFEELAAGWPQIYDLKNQQFLTSINSQGVTTTSMSSLTDGNMFLDFIDAGTSSLGAYAVSAIGRRTDVVTDSDVNCLFQPEIPDIVFVDSSSEDLDAQTKELEARGEKYSQTPHEIYSALATGGYKNGAFDRIKYELYLHTGYQRTLSITAIPAFYLEPYTRVSVSDKTTNTYGDYLIKSITYTLGTGSSMTVNAAEVVERF